MREIRQFWQGELGTALGKYRRAIVTVALLSAVLNFVVLGGSFYMMLVYDSVLPSHSLPTLAGLFVMVVVVYLFQGLFEVSRTRILTAIGAAMERELAPRIQRATSELTLRSGKLTGDGLMAMRDLDQIRAFLAGTGPGALIDMPWILFFLAILTLLHYWLGLAALVGAVLLIGLTVWTDRMTTAPSRELGRATSLRGAAAESNLRHVEALAALGMRERMRIRWEAVNAEFLSMQDRLARNSSFFGSLSRVARQFLQSVMLTVGALLVIAGDASGGVIFASSILFGRALAPVDLAIANWRGFAAAREGWRRLEDMLSRIPAPREPEVRLPLPSRELLAEGLVIAPPGSQNPTVQNVSVRLAAGEAVGIVGPSGAGKTTFGKALIGLWHPLRGAVRLDGATLDQWDPERLGQTIGYLPQAVELFEGSIAENIARFDPAADADAIMAAAREAGVHEMVVQFPRGYDTPVGRDGTELSAGQRQRIGLARALYGRPFLVLLDEPNSNLDQTGEAALEAAIASVRARGGIVAVIAHRASVLGQVSHLLCLRSGLMEAFGPRDEVLAKIARPATGAPVQPGTVQANGVSPTAGVGAGKTVQSSISRRGPRNEKVG